MPNTLNYEATITLKDQDTKPYVAVEVYGEANYENARDLWMRIAQTCRDTACYKILGENHFNNPVSTIDAYRHKDIFMETGISGKARVAWVDSNPATFQSTEFIGHVLGNRALINGRIFRDKIKAKVWLLTQ